MCELFGQCLPEPSAIQIRSDIVEERFANSYTEIRRQLLESGSDLPRSVEIEPLPEDG